jgi:hypothetical protein
VSVSVSLFCVGDDVALDGSDPGDVAAARAGEVSGASFVASVSASDSDEDELFALLSLIADVTGAIDATIQGCTRIPAANVEVATTQIAAAVSRSLTDADGGNTAHWASTLIGAMTLTAHNGCDLMWCTSWDQGGTVADPKGEYTTGWTTP